MEKSTPAAPASSGVPNLPRTTEPTPTAHRDEIAEEPTQVNPACIARKLSRKEMGTCPKAKKRPLDAEWEQPRTLKRPYPAKGFGAWDETNVREASEVRAKARQDGNAVHFGRICELCHEKG